MMALKSHMVEFQAEGRSGRGYLATPEKPRGGVLVLHAWWGLNDFFKSFADKLASQGFVALAPDLYDGPVAKSVEEAKELHSKVDNERIKQIVIGATDYLGTDSSISGRKIGVIGFSMAQASFLGHFAPDDEWEPVADVRATEEKIRGAEREVTFHFYPGTKHWFVEESRPVEYNRAASDLAWKRTLEFLNSKLR